MSPHEPQTSGQPSDGDVDGGVPGERSMPQAESGISAPMTDEEPELLVDADTGEGTGIEDVASRNSFAGKPRMDT